MDSEISKDGGTFADCTNEATEIATSSGMYFLDLTATEMNADTVAIIVKTTTVGAKTTPIVMYPEEIGDYRVDVLQWNSAAVAVPTVAGVPEVDVTNWVGLAVNALISGRVDASVGAMAANVLTATAINADAITAAKVAADVGTEIRSLASGTADSGTTTTMVDAARTEADTDYWKGNLIQFTSGTLLGQTRLITAFTPATDTITFAPATTVAVATHTYEILPAGRADIHFWLGVLVNALIAGRVDANAQVVGDKTGYSIGTGGITSGSFAAGAIDNTAFNVTETLTANPATGGIVAASFAAGAIDAAALAADAGTEIAAAVWDRDATLSQTQGTFGQVVGDSVLDTDTIWSLANANLDAAVSSRASAAALATVQADTDDIQTRLPAALVVGRMDASVGAYQTGLTPLQPTVAGRTLDVTATGEAGIDLDNTVGTLAKTTDITGFNDLSAAQVKTEVVNALNVDTYAEPGQGAPPATATLVQRLQYLYKAWRNRTTQTASQYTLYGDDALTVDQKATFSDDATTADRGEVATGP